MIKTVALLILGAAFYAPIMAVGSAAIGFASETVQHVNQQTADRCAAYNAVTPGTCIMP